MNSHAADPRQDHVPANRSQRKQKRWTANSERGLELAAAQVCQILSRLDGEELGETLEMNAREYVSLVQALVRLNEVRLRQEWQRSRIRAEREKKQADSNAGSQPKGLTPETLASIEEALNLS